RSRSVVRCGRDELSADFGSSGSAAGHGDVAAGARTQAAARNAERRAQPLLHRRKEGTMSCAQWHDRIQLYADGELAAADRDAFRAHAQSCAACAAQALAAAEAKLAVRSAGQRYEAPADLRARVARIARGEHGLAIAAVADRDYAQRRSRWFAMPRWAMA